MTYVISNLSESQVKWVKSTGFGNLLDFHMVYYTHNLGYNVVEAFNESTCSVMVEAGTVNINDSIVHQVMGFQNGDDDVVLKDDRSEYFVWGE